MRVVFEYTEDGHCNEIEDFDSKVINNDNFLNAFPEVEFIKEKVQGSNYFRFKIYGEKYHEINGRRIDLLSNYLSKVFKVR